MSVRAYKLIEIKTAEDPTFNCWHDTDIFDLADSENYNENGGIISFDKLVIEQEIIEIKEKKKLTQNDKEKLSILKQILKDIGDDFDVQYYCY